jgi:hypothetical protein
MDALDLVQGVVLVGQCTHQKAGAQKARYIHPKEVGQEERHMHSHNQNYWSGNEPGDL